MLQKYIEILTRDEVIFRKKPDGTEVNYFLFPEFEIHINSLPGKTVNIQPTYLTSETLLLFSSTAMVYIDLTSNIIASSFNHM